MSRGSRIARLAGLEVLDSRGRPTVQATCQLAGGAVGVASVPSGASTGGAEARELRDCEPGRYRGLGCRRAVENIDGTLAADLVTRSFGGQDELDRALVELDGTPDKARLGANALLAVSLAFARALALERSLPLFAYFAELVGTPPALPRPLVNLFSGGKHAGGQIPIQDVLIVPLAAARIDDALAACFEVYQAAAELTSTKYGTRALKADEGGLAPPFPSGEAAIEDAVECVEAAGFEPGREVALAVDVAATHFHTGGRYELGAEAVDAAGMIALLSGWLERYPILALEDPLGDEDWGNWPLLRRAAGARALVIGDDLLCTNPARIRRAIETEAAGALLLKVNQIGTVTEAAAALALAHEAGWSVIASARSGETEDAWLADLAVGWAADGIKIGSITQSDRLAKYNRLLAIEAESALALADWPPPQSGS